jgi:hypothetical protein
MTEQIESLRSRLEAARGEALRVHDSPLRADGVAAQVQKILDGLDAGALGEDRSARVRSQLADALRVLRRDDDGREAARHLQSALALLDAPPRRPSPFLDD